MNKRVFLFLCFAWVTLCAFAGDIVNVTLSDSRQQYTKRLDYCNITFTRVDSGNDEELDVKIEIENKLDQLLMVFDRAYTEKDLKRQKPKIKFDKRFPGGHVIIPCRGLRVVQRINPQDNQDVCSFTVQNNTTEERKLPIYIAKWKNRKHKAIILQSLEELELNIKVESGNVDRDIERLRYSYDSLLQRVRNNPICPNKDHHLTKEFQKKEYQEAASKLRADIESVINKYGLVTGNEKYRLCRDMSSSLYDLPFDEVDCGRHRTTGRTRRTGDVVPTQRACQWCNMSLEAIYRKMDDNNVAMIRGRKRKRDLASEMNAIYTCCTSHASHASEWQSGGNIRSKIERLYQEFNSYR